jgi:hypothetical protein
MLFVIEDPGQWIRKDGECFFKRNLMLRQICPGLLLVPLEFKSHCGQCHHAIRSFSAVCDHAGQCGGPGACAPHEVESFYRPATETDQRVDSIYLIDKPYRHGCRLAFPSGLPVLRGACARATPRLFRNPVQFQIFRKAPPSPARGCPRALRGNCREGVKSPRITPRCSAGSCGSGDGTGLHDENPEMLFMGCPAREHSTVIACRCSKPASPVGNWRVFTGGYMSSIDHLAQSAILNPTGS